MLPPVSRRQFLTNVSGAFLSSLFTALPIRAFAHLYPPADLSYFERPITPAPGKIHFGYAAITWNENDRQAIEDISSLGFSGIQLRSNVLKEFGGDAAPLRQLLDAHRLQMVALSSGNLSIERDQAEELATHLAHARFVHDVGGLYLQVIAERPKSRAVVPEDCNRMGRLLTELGKRTADLGISLGLHNHMDSLAESPEEVDRVFSVADSRYVKLELDVAHYFQGGGDPAQAIESYRDRLLFLHIKDVEKLPVSAAADPKHAYRFVELGRGLVDLPAVFAALDKVAFRGWAIIELDKVPDPSRTPKDSARISIQYLQEKLGLAL